MSNCAGAKWALRLFFTAGQIALLPVIVAAQLNFFTPDPRWESPEPNATRSVAVGDIDLDGDLDLVCGNSQQFNTLFLNDDGTLGISSSWFPANIDRTRSLALGDLDGDGYLDLVCGNFAGTNTVYFNVGGSLAMVADTVQTSNSGESIALGDLDNDGDLDIVFGIPLFPNAAFLNEGGAFPGPPILFGGANETRAIALGDVDGDGFLDVVEGNLPGSNPGVNHLYLNPLGVLDSIPSWSSETGQQTMDVELADMNGDGLLDLICANLSLANTIYYGHSTTLLDTVASWVSTPAQSSREVDVGDFDSDGDLDLVFANFAQANALYLNDLTNPPSAPLATDPVWFTGPTNRTLALAFADLNGDGGFDIVAGNSDELNTTYVNLEPPLQAMPAWESEFPTPNRTKSVVLADVDNDGDLDLACGNGGADARPNVLYYNLGSTFEDSPTWASVQARQTASIALGDIDSDGLLDMVAGNQGIAGEENAAYESTLPPFSRQTTWTSLPAEVTTGVALADVNGDALLDLVCGNASDSSALYINLGAGLGTQPAWLAAMRQRTSGIVLGDVDSDGDVDLVCGNNGEPNTLFRNDGQMFATTPDWSSSLDLFTTDVTLGDVDGDGDLDLVCANNPQANTVYFNEGGTFVQSAGWSSRPPARATTGVALGDLDGDGDLDLVCSNELFAANTAFMNEGGVLERSPRWLSGMLNDTEAVALGDVDRDGDLDVVFGNENAPNTLYLGRMNPAYQQDPTAPTHQQTNNSAFFATAETRRLGPNAYRIVFSLVDIESDPTWVLLEYQFEGEPVWHPAVVSGHVGTFVSAPTAVIDSLDWDTSQVPSDSRGIVLRLTAIEVPQRSSVVRRTTSYLMRVGQIPLVDSFARPSSGSEFFETRDVIVSLRLPPGATSDEARLYYRRGGESAYEEATFAAGTPMPVATIPSDWVTARGLEYWVEVQTGGETLTDPRTDASQSPHAIRVTATNLEEPREHPGLTFRLMSIPLELESSVSIIQALQDDLGFPDPRRWRLIMFGAADTAYVEVPNDSVLAFEQGRGYWLITKNPHRLDTAPIFGKSAPTGDPYELLLEPGWNLIGHPFAFSVSWSTLGVDVADVEPPIAWRGDSYEYDVDRLEPWEGYWINNRTSSQYLLQVPSVEAPPAVASGASEGDTEAWQVWIAASSRGAMDSHNVFGVRSGASSTWDVHDRSEAPMGPERGLSLYFPHPYWQNGQGNYTIDVRGNYEELDDATSRAAGLGPDARGHLWRFDVAKRFSDVPAGDEVVLDFAGIDGVPEDAHVLLIDRQLKRVVDLRQHRHYAFYLGTRGIVADEEAARFALLVGGDAFTDAREGELLKAPVRTALHESRPNPFNPVTIIRYEIAETSPVSLIIYDASGARVRDLYAGTREPGVYEAQWAATNDAGDSVASGIYFCRLVAGEVTETRKMLLLK